MFGVLAFGAVFLEVGIFKVRAYMYGYGAPAACAFNASIPSFFLTMSTPTGKLARYKQALSAVSARTGTPLPSLILSFGILHELTAIVPVVGIFYSARAMGIGERVVSAVIDEKQQSSGGRTQSDTYTSNDMYSWTRQKMRTWVEEGDRWAIRVGRRYGIFGYDKRAPGVVDDVEEMVKTSNHIAGDVANAVFAYGATKVKL